MNAGLWLSFAAIVVATHARSTDKLHHGTIDLMRLLSQPVSCTNIEHQNMDPSALQDILDKSEMRPMDYMDDSNQLTQDGVDFSYEDDPRQPMRKRTAVSPYISLGALSNLQQFFQELKGSMDVIDQQKAMAQAAAAETDRSYRPPATAAVLHAFRNYRPLRRTRSYPPALLQG